MRHQNFLLALPNEAFSKREIEILVLMADGLSNQDIAGKIFLSLGTVKWYNKQIFKKLGVSNRTQAIVRARELGLFATTSNLSPHEDSLPKHNLPARLSTFIGRSKELADLLALLQRKSRLVTIIGTGGIGKTALALRAVEESLSSFIQVAWFVDLAPLTDPGLVEQEIAHTLGIHEESGVPLHDLLVRFLGPQRLLLILDNCEHLVEACAELAASLLQACPDLHILATSREPLGVSGEVCYLLTALTFPDSGQTPLLEALKRYEAVQLFSQRASLVSPGFEITQENAQAVSQLCQRLDGLPLALELAAACVNLLSVSQIVDHLDALLWKHGNRARPLHPRHRSLQACLDWSYSLLSAPERILLQRLSVFTGGWTLEAAVEVCADPQGKNQRGYCLLSNAILEILGELVNKSLVVAQLAGAIQPEREMRYHLLDTIHQYAHERLTEAGEDQTLRDRHLAYFMKITEQAAPKMRSAEQSRWLHNLETERANLQAAMFWALAADRPDKNFYLDRVKVGLRLGNALLYFWELRNPLPSDMDLLKRGLEQINPQDEGLKGLRAKTLFSIATLLSWEEVREKPTYPCIKVFEESIFLFRAVGDLPGLALALSRLAWMIRTSPRALPLINESVAICRQVGDRWILADSLWNQRSIVDDAKALACVQESLALFRETGDPMRMNRALAGLGGFSVRLGNYAAGNAYLEESARFFREQGNLNAMITSYHLMGPAAYYLDDYNQMITCFGSALDILRQRGKIGFSVLYMRMMGTAYKHLGDFSQSAGYFLESLSTAQELGETRSVCMALSGLAGVAAAVNQPVHAIHLMSAAEAALEVLNERKDAIDQVEFDRDMTRLQAQLDPETLAIAWAKGRELRLEEAIKEAFATTI